MKVAREQFVLFEWRPRPSNIDERDTVDEKEDKGEVHSPQRNPPHPTSIKKNGYRIQKRLEG